MGRELGPRRAAATRSRGITCRLARTNPLSFDAAAAAREALARRPDLRDLRAPCALSTRTPTSPAAGYYPLIRLYLAGELSPQSFVRSNPPNAVRASDQVQTTEIRPGVQRGLDRHRHRHGARRRARRIDAVARDLAVGLAAAGTQHPGRTRRRARPARRRRREPHRGPARQRGHRAKYFEHHPGRRCPRASTRNSNSSTPRAACSSTRSGLLDAELAMSLAHAEFDRITGRYLQFVTDAARRHPIPRPPPATPRPEVNLAPTRTPRRQAARCSASCAGRPCWSSLFVLAGRRLLPVRQRHQPRAGGRLHRLSAARRSRRCTAPSPSTPATA